MPGTAWEQPAQLRTCTAVRGNSQPACAPSARIEAAALRRGVYCLLRHLHALTGLWRYKEPGKQGRSRLCHVRWSSCQLAVVLLGISSYSGALEETELAAVTPLGACMLDGSGSEEGICVLKDYGSSPTQPVCPTAEAAASVATSRNVQVQHVPAAWTAPARSL